MPITTELLAGLGSPKDFVDDMFRNAAAVVAGTGLYGVYAMLFCLLLCTVTTPQRRKNITSTISLLFMFLMFAMSSLLLAGNVASLLVYIRRGAMDSELLFLSIRSITELQRAINVVFFVECMLGDLLVVFRALVFYDSSAWIWALLVALWSGAFGAGLGFSYCVGGGADDVEVSGHCAYLQHISWTISVSLNALASILLARITWNYRQVARDLGFHRSKVYRVLSVLVVSAAVYSILGLTRLTSFADNLSSKITLVDRILQLVAHQLVGIYPTAVSVVIFNEKSIFGSSDEPPNLVRKRDRDAKSQITRAPSGVIEVV